MSYTINEENVERQQLLAEILNPVAIEILKKVGPLPGSRCLDLGCGQGNTTRMLAGALTPRECIGLDYDANLIAYASAQSNPPGLHFQQGSAMELPFDDASFDVVFTRYLLVHLPDPELAAREMKRVLKPGGRAVAYEPDFTHEFAEPESFGITQMTKIWRGMFPQPTIGRRLPGIFGALGMNVETGTFLGVETGLGPYRRIYRMTLEAMKEGILGRGIETEAEYNAHLAELRRLEEDPKPMVVKFPDFWVIATN
ncbi:MAG: methyltransferase domain-containing protein [Bryobacteraceae bacterium]|nr:methyltransferase domain-containing protein [Bryobacteraceae bacterium]